MATDSPGRSVARIVDVLNCFSVEEPVHNLTSISSRIGLAKSTTHRLVNTLLAQGLLMRDVYGRGYQLGYQMMYWGMVAQASLDLRNEALPILRTLSRAVGETTILTVRSGLSGLCLEMVETMQPVRMAMRVGQRLMLHAGANGKVLLAFSAEHEIEHALDTLELVPLAARTITDRDALAAELAEICRRGYATSFEETDPGAMGISAPVYDHTGQVVAGIGVAAPASRIPPESVPEFAPLVLDAARQLSARLGARS